MAWSSDTGTTIERGRLIVFQDDEPVATERFAYTLSGDSIVIEAVHSRRMRGADGAVAEFKKSAGLVVNRLDFGLIRYLSNQHASGHESVTGTSMAPGDTVITIFRETDGAGTASTLDLPPGRVFIIDPLIFSLFDVMCRNLGRQTFETRPVSLITMGEPPQAVEASVTRALGDTLVWGGKPVSVTRLTFADEQSKFVAWVDREGRMLRFEASDGRVRVEREPDAAPAPAPKQRSKR